MNGCALLVIDVQVGVFDLKASAAIHQADGLLESVSELIGAARSADVPVIFIQHCGPEGELLAEGTKNWEIHPSVAPTPSETVVLKRESSAFVGTQLEKLLAQRSIHTVITCGLQSEFCVSNTSISALEAGLNVCVARDAHSTFSTEADDASVIIDRQNSLLAARGARVQTTAALIEEFAPS